MPLELSFMEEEDIPEFADIDDAAMAGSRLAKAMENSDSARGSRKGLILEYVRKGFHADSRQAYLKVTDTDTGEMVAVALWRFVLEPEEKNPEEAPAASEEVVEKAKEDPEVPKELGVPEGLGRPSVLATMLRQWEEFVDECFPSEPYASTFKFNNQFRTPQDLCVNRSPNSLHASKTPTTRRREHAAEMGL